MKINFDNIHSFINYQKNCRFCNKRLKAFLLGARLGTLENKNLRVKYTWKMFNFKYNGYLCSIDGCNDRITMKDTILDREISSYISPTTHFYNWYPYIEVSCTNRKCKMFYYYTGSVMCVSKYDINAYCSEVDGKLFTTSLDSECVRIEDKFWVQKDFNDETTYIYSIDKPNKDPTVLSQLIDLNCDPDNLIRRIKTIVTFG